MALVVKQLSEDPKDFDDITLNLHSLQFESALSEDEKHFLILRKRSHALTVSACAQATYFVTVLNEARQIKAQLHNPDQKKASRLLQDGSPRDPLLVGIVGCGRMGSHLAHCFLTFGEVSPDEMKISTRRPETLSDLREKGVACFHHNAKVASSAHIIFLCVLPSQLPKVAEEIKDNISSQTIIYSLVAGVPLSRLKHLLNHNNVVKPEFRWDLASADKDWSYAMEVTAAFGVSSMLEKTCPLSLHKADSVVTTETSCAEQQVYGLVNACTMMGLNKAETVDVVNAVVLGHSNKAPLQDRLEQDDITRLRTDSKFFPKFDLCRIIDRETPLTRKLVHNEYIRKAFLARYCSIFQHYLDWKSQALQLARKQIHFSFD